jgi:hypothetical protein
VSFALYDIPMAAVSPIADEQHPCHTICSRLTLLGLFEIDKGGIDAMAGDDRADALVDQGEAAETLIVSVEDDFRMDLGWELLEGHACTWLFTDTDLEMADRRTLLL